jgi:Domain of unknown function (DUF4386)
MTNNFKEISQNKAAKIAGIGYLIIFILGIVTNFFVFNRMLVPGDAQATVNNILSNEILFRSGIVSWLVVLIIDIIIAWSLYIFLKPVNKSFSLLAAWFRLVYVAIFGIAQLNLLFVIILLSGANFLGVFNTEQLNALVLIFLNGHNYSFLIALVFFGVHLYFISYLVFKSDFVPKSLGVLLLLAAFGYLIDSFANFLLPDYADYKTIFMIIVAVPGIIGELYLTLWLLFRGVKLQAAAL